MTAAHCIEGTTASAVRVYTGCHELVLNGFNASDPSTFEYCDQARTVKSLKIHESWDTIIVANDIGLIELNEPIDFTNNDRVRPVCLPNNTPVGPIGTNYYICGWGLESSASSALAQILNEAI